MFKKNTKIKTTKEKPAVKKSVKLVDKQDLTDEQFAEMELLECGVEIYKRDKGLK